MALSFADTSRAKEAFRLWDLKTGAARPSLWGADKAPGNWTFSRDGQWVSFQELTQKIGELQAKTTEWPQTFQLSPDGQTLAVMSLMGPFHASMSDYSPPPFVKLALWSVAGPRLRKTLLVKTWIDAMRFSPDGQQLAAWERVPPPKLSTNPEMEERGTPRLHVWDAATGNERFVIAPKSELAQRDWAACLVFSADGRVLAATAEGGRAWDAKTGKATPVSREFALNSEIAAISPDGALFVARGFVEGAPNLGEPDGVTPAFVAQTATGQDWSLLTARFPPFHEPPRFAPPGGQFPLLASTPGNATVEFWNAETGQKVAALTFLTGEKSSLEWLVQTPDGFYDASPGAETFLRWKTYDATGEIVLHPASFGAAQRRPDVLGQVLKR